MRTLHATGFAAVLAATALVAPGGASAASPTMYSGTFDGTVQYVGCTTPGPDNYATGDWSVTMHGTSAKGSFTIMFGTETHVAYTFPGMKQAPGNTESDWLVSGRTMAGLLTVAVHGDDMTYTIEPYNYGGLSCDRAVFPGYVDRD
jgi:hypothetical protein